MPRIALIHAVAVAIPPVHDAFRQLWPEAECVDILDTSLSRDREREGRLTEKMVGRFLLLARYAEDNGADGILFTCSAFGEAIEQAAGKASIPVLKPNEAMFEAALAAGKRLGMLATFEPSVAGMEEEFRDMAGDTKSKAALSSFCVPGAMKALQAGDGAEHDQLVAIAAPRFADHDAVLLAHFSTSRAAAAVKAVVRCPVLTAPSAAVTKMKGMIG
ncbi:MAG TPA: aspartate/glutamate racemase family protein [Stellaceae bacterium]|jgi:Asp/Glu/hydantoin racemase|nr:aspartate/glutamate racemase family protein [Stellaceae bacterium]